MSGVFEVFNYAQQTHHLRKKLVVHEPSHDTHQLCGKINFSWLDVRNGNETLYYVLLSVAVCSVALLTQCHCDTRVRIRVKHQSRLHKTCAFRLFGSVLSKILYLHTVGGVRRTKFSATGRCQMLTASQNTDRHIYRNFSNSTGSKQCFGFDVAFARLLSQSVCQKRINSVTRSRSRSRHQRNAVERECMRD